jgi:DNA-binding response OmpR family regulator
MQVLLVGGYRPLLRALGQALEEEGFQVEVGAAESWEPGTIVTAGFDAIVLDLMRRGPSPLPSWRRAGLRAYVLALTPPGFDHDGADGCLTKPFALEEFVAHLRAIPGRP